MRFSAAAWSGSLGGQLSTELPATPKTWFHGTGRRKESVARVFLRAGSGKFTVNKRTVEVYFPNHAWKHDAVEPLKFTSLSDRSEEHTSELQSHSFISYAVFCLKKT